MIERTIDWLEGSWWERTYERKESHCTTVLGFFRNLVCIVWAWIFHRAAKIRKHRRRIVSMPVMPAAARILLGSIEQDVCGLDVAVHYGLPTWTPCRRWVRVTFLEAQSCFRQAVEEVPEKRLWQDTTVREVMISLCVADDAKWRAPYSTVP